jgi:N-acyl-D-amino-acid deacylase
MIKRSTFAAIAVSLLGSSAIAQLSATESYDLLIDNGTIYDGMGGAPFTGDVAIRGDRIVYVGPEAPGTAKKTVDASGMAVSPGFINMLSWAIESLIHDGRGLSDTVQGVTLQVFGEGQSMGPLNATMKRNEIKRQGDIKYPIKWTTLGEYLSYLQRKGVTPNVASFVGAATVRIHELGEGDVDPTPEQLTRMRGLVRSAMQ